MKKVFALLLALVMSLSLVACGGGSDTTEDTSSDTTTTSEDDGKLVIWTNLTAESQTKVLQEQFDAVAKEMGVEIEMVTVAFGDMYTKLAAAMESGDTPDIMHTTEGGSAYLYAQDLLAEMDDVIDAIGRDDFVESYLRSITDDGVAWGVPDWALHTSVWYRKDLFAEKGIEVPTNWEELTAAAEALNIDENNDGNTDIYGFAVPMAAVQLAAQSYYEFLFTDGVYTFDPATGEYNFGSEKEHATEVLDYMIDLYKKASPPSSTEWSWSENRNALVEGSVAMVLDMGAVIGLAQTNNPDMVENLGCFDLPGKDGDKQASFGGGYYFVASNQGSDAKIALAKEFITKLYTPERAAQRALSRPMFAYPSVYSAFDIYKADPSVAQFQDEIDNIFDAFENNTWYRYGMEAGLSQMASQIEATTFFGEAIQAVALDMQTSAEAVDYIDAQLQEQLAIIGE